MSCCLLPSQCSGGSNPTVKVARFGPKVGQIGPRSYKSGTFSDRISVHFGSGGQNVLKSDLNLKKSRICPIWGESEPDPPENCHLTVKKIAKNCHFLQKKL